MTAERAGTMAGRRARGWGMVDALHAEWTKLRTVSGPSWLLVGIVALTVAVSAAAVGATRCTASMQCAADPAKLSLAGVQFGQAVVAILAVLMICNEYSTGMIKITLTAMPRRLEMYAAKAIITAGVVLVAGALAVLGSVLAGYLILPGHGFTTARGFHRVSLSYGPVLRAAGGSVLYLALIALLSLGGRAGGAVPVPDHPRLRDRSDLAASARPLDAHQLRAGHPGHHRRAEPRDQPVGRAGSASHLGRRGAATRRPYAPRQGRLKGGPAGYRKVPKRAGWRPP